jgi:hypothetical protein
VADRLPEVELSRFFTKLQRLRHGEPDGDDVSVPIPDGLNWFVWRVATHERSRASLIEIQTEWSLADLVDAHMALDVHDELQRRLSQRLKKP